MKESETIQELVRYKKRDFIPYAGLILHNDRLAEAQALIFANDVKNRNTYHSNGVPFGVSEQEFREHCKPGENLFEIYHICSALVGVAILALPAWLPVLKEGIEKFF